VDLVRSDLFAMKNDFRECMSVFWSCWYRAFNNVVTIVKMDLAYSINDVESFLSPSSSHMNILTRCNHGFIRKGWSSYAIAWNRAIAHFALDDNDVLLLLASPPPRVLLLFVER